MLYGCFEANVRASDSSVFDHEMPGGQYTNLMVKILLISNPHNLLFYSSKLHNSDWVLSGRVRKSAPIRFVLS
jgi:pyruvate carboxylase